MVGIRLQISQILGGIAKSIYAEIESIPAEKLPFKMNPVHFQQFLKMLLAHHETLRDPDSGEILAKQTSLMETLNFVNQLKNESAEYKTHDGHFRESMNEFLEALFKRY
jgi:hypothetical protein